MIGSLAGFVGRRARLVVVIALALGVGGAWIGAPAVEVMTNSPADFDDPASESVKAQLSLSEAADVSPGADAVALVRLGADVGSPLGRSVVEGVARELATEPGVGRVDVPGAAADRALVAADRRSALIPVSFEPGADPDVVAERLLGRFAGDGRALLGGEAVAGTQFGQVVAEDLKRAEILAFPLLLVLTVCVFRGLVAALVPVLVGALAVAGSLAGLRLVAEAVPVSVFALNVVLGLGLGLAVDYSLLMLGRYRELVAARRPLPEALRMTLATAGRTVLFSALTVSASLAALLVFPQRFLYSVGLGGMLVSLLAGAASLIVLPAVLAALGDGIDAGSFGGRRSASQVRGRAASERWARMARLVTKHPRAFAAGASALLVVAALPVLDLEFTSVDARVLPEGASARRVADAVRAEFPGASGTVAHLAARAPGDAGVREELEGYASRLEGLRGAQTVTEPVRAGKDLWRIDVLSGSDALSPEGRALVRGIRGAEAPYPVAVAGPTARFLDQQASMARHLPAALVVALGSSTVLLFAVTGSLVLPPKAALMNVLSVGAAGGIAVVIFQHGHLESALGFESLGAIGNTSPAVVLVLAYALSTDYTVFLLSRIKEARDGGADDAEAIVVGFGRTGGIITAAALLFCVALGAFALSRIVLVKEVGVGAALAVLIDATVVRALLVPSLMMLLGGANWWPRRFAVLGGAAPTGGRELAGDGFASGVDPTLPTSITVDLDREQHRLLERFALGRDLEDGEVVRALLEELRDDPRLAARLEERMGAHARKTDA